MTFRPSLLCLVLLLAAAMPAIAMPPTSSEFPYTTTECGICKLAATVVDSYFLTNMTETEIDAYACLIFPSAWQHTCQQLLNDFLPYIMEQLKEGFDPTAICSDLKLCSDSPARAALQMPYRPRLHVRKEL